MRCGLAIFAKTVGLSPVKTRLAAEIGVAQAEAFYGLSKACTEAVVRAVQRRKPESVFPVWALAEEAGPSRVGPETFPAVWTGAGGLGERLASMGEMLHAEHEAAIVMGTDSPQLTPQQLAGAVDRVMARRQGAVAGPAKDGGFYLFGSVRPIARSTWEAVRYSCDTTLEDLEARLQEDGIAVSRLESERDVDRVADLDGLLGDLKAREGQLLDEQRDLMAWLEARERHRG